MVQSDQRFLGTGKVGLDIYFLSTLKQNFSPESLLILSPIFLFSSLSLSLPVFCLFVDLSLGLSVTVCVSLSKGMPT